jgi:GntR family transcriptional regulator/MocR family aminotransferase
MTNVPFIMLADKSAQAIPLYRQIYEAIRRAILNGEFEARMQLPATRILAKQLGVSRMTVINAYEQLFAEGYLEGKTGAGTFVASQIPEELLQISQSAKKNKTTETTGEKVKISKFAERIAETQTRVSRFQSSTSTLPFKNGLTAVSEFPFDVWEKIATRVYRQSRYKISGYGEAAGYRVIRKRSAFFAPSEHTELRLRLTPKALIWRTR